MWVRNRTGNSISLMVNMYLQSRSVKKPRARPGGNFLARLICGRLRLSLFFCLLVSALIPRTAAGQGDSVDEYKLKAAMLYNLTYFVEWPPSAYSNPQAPILLCILGKDPFGNFLTSTVLKQTVNGRPLLILHPQNDKEV